MELADFEKLWKENDKRLEKSLSLNEKMIYKLKKEAIGDFAKLLTFYKFGRNMALVYFIISVVLSCLVLSDLKYSIPGLVGGALMLWSFFYHLSTTEKLNEREFYDLPVIDLQKKINSFRISSLNVGKYDFMVVAIWFLTTTPLYRLLFFEVDTYSSSGSLWRFFLISGLLIVLLFPLNQLYYKMYIGKKLEEAENNLDMISEFENEG